MKPIVLNVNGVERTVVCDPERDNLADCLRNLGFTGVKVGCGTGECGTCSVILNGKVIRSCVRKMKNVPEYSKITTIEGIGIPGNLHPLQQAWITCGAIQCGFCTPGFIVSSKALLEDNPRPTREEVRAWFKSHSNACRCTGYKQITDAVMLAAKVLRGEKTMDDITFKVPDDGRIYGTTVPRPTAVGKVSGTLDYGADLNAKLPDGVLYMAPVLAKVSRGRLISSDYSEAEKMPGVEKIVTCKDVKGTNRIFLMDGKKRTKNPGNLRPILVEDNIFRYGDVVALVCATSKQQAKDASEKVKLEIEKLPANMNVLESLADGAPQVHNDIPNAYMEVPHILGEETAPIYEEAAYTVNGSYSTQRQPHFSLEPETGLAYVDDQGVLTIHYKSQFIYIVKPALSHGVGFDKENIRLVGNNAGASFGYSMSPAYPALLSVGAIATGKLCAMDMSFADHMHYSPKRNASYTNVKFAADKNGKLLAMDYHLCYDVGPYSTFSNACLEKGPTYMGNPYKVRNIRGLTQMVFTNHACTAPYRSYGTVSSTWATEVALNELAIKMGMDPLEFRALNVYQEGDLGNTDCLFESYELPGMIEKARPIYKEWKARAEAESTSEVKRGVGVACSTYKAGANVNDQSESHLELMPDGTVTHYNSWEDMGQGGDVGTLVHTHECLRQLGLSIDQIHVVMNDTGKCPNSGPAAGSRSHLMTGRATEAAAEKMLAAMRKPDGTYRTYDEMVKEGLPTKFAGIYSSAGEPDLSNIDENTGLGKNVSNDAWNVMLAAVAVEVATGKVKVEHFYCISDIGTIGSIHAVEGQAYSGIQHSIGMALSEDMREDLPDRKKSETMHGCGFPYIDMVPDDMQLEFVDSYRERGSHGSGGCSESYQSGGHAAIMNAITNACGVIVRELPATPNKILAELKNVAVGKPTESKDYYLGCDLYEHLEDIQNNPV